jgi:hypothetical protein
MISILRRGERMKVKEEGNIKGEGKGREPNNK